MDSNSDDTDRLGEIVAAFVAVREAGVHVEMTPFLCAVACEQQEPLFAQLLAADISVRTNQGESPQPDDYLKPYPQFHAIITNLLPAKAMPADLSDGHHTDPLRTATRPEPAPGTVMKQPSRVPGYDIVRLIGKGGMGEVYEAVHKATGRQVALKMLLSEQIADESKAQLFLREATTLSRLDHKRIVKFHEVGIAAGQLYLAMEYVDAIDVDTLLAQRHEGGCVRLFCGAVCQVLSALSYAHSLGYVHRDVKPSNVLLAHDGQKYFAKLADFGLAKSYEDAGYSSITSLGACRGTIAFMAPEQLDNPQSVGPSADIFSAAATLYYFLSGHLPRDMSAHPNPVLAVLEGEIIPLNRWRSELPAGLSDLVHRGLARLPEERYSSADQMHRELLRFGRKEQE